LAGNIARDTSIRRLGRLFDERCDLLGVQQKYDVASGEFERLGLGSAGHESFEIGIDLAILLRNHCEARFFHHAATVTLAPKESAAIGTGAER
jgi:hypothetical protein